MLNNANPVKVCVHLQMADLRQGESVFHAGAGTGYFTALMAELVGTGGRVVAAEIDPLLQETARRNLAPWPQVRVIGDALKSDLSPVDMIYCSAGMGDIPLAWIEALRPGGRMILPITGAHDHGAVFLFRKTGADGPLAANVQSFTRYYPCLGTRDAESVEQLTSAFRRPVSSVASLRLDPHAPEKQCWLHRDHWCLSCRKA